MDALEQKIESLLSQLSLKEKIAFLSGKDAWGTAPVERLGIPSLTVTDGPHGVRAAGGGRIIGATTAFPTGSAMAASWNPELIERVGAALAQETLAMGCDVLLGPCVNIVRHPLAGRNFEAYSEDPYLAGGIGIAWVKGLQSQGVGASLKHFACNNQEIERFRGSSEIDERTLREIYLAQFEMVVKQADPWTVMCSYNRINGVYASQNAHLLNEILKSEWEYPGVVVSDWNANHTTVESVAHGLDLEMPGPARYYGKLLYDAVNNWQIEPEAIDNAVRRILRMIGRSGRLDTPRPAGSVNPVAHQQLARELAEEAITLLKNENAILPLNLNAIKSIAVIGPNAAEWQISGGGSSRVDPPYQVSPLDALKAKLNNRVRIDFEQGCDNYAEPPTIPAHYLTLPDSAEHGLRGEYFQNTEFAGTPALVRTDTKFDIWWWDDGSYPNLSFSKFSVRWTGKLTVPESGRYALKLGNSAATRVYLDGTLVHEQDRSDVSAPSENFNTLASVELVGGKPYAVRIEFVKAHDEENYAFLRVGLMRAYRPHEDDRLTRAFVLAKESDVAIVFAGLPYNYETEGNDRAHMDLTGAQNELINIVAQANPNTIVVLNAGAPITMPWIDRVPAVVLGYYTGMEAGNAITKVLCGDTNPSGKLTVTFPKQLKDTSAFTDYPGTRAVRYGESVFVGYRWYDARAIEPLFPFGHGLSYTTFEYGALNAPREVKLGESIAISLTVKNTGAVDGKEIVQVYVADKHASLARPLKELKRWQKIALAPGEMQTVRFALDVRALSFYDPNAARWVAEPGEFEILVGSSSRDIRARAMLVAS